MWIDRFEAGGHDDALLTCAQQGELVWSSGVAENFSRRFGEAMSKRLNDCGRRLERSLGACRTEHDLSRALVDARYEFGHLRRVTAIGCLPDILREHLSSMVCEHLSKRQEALEETAKADRSGRLSLAIRANPLTRLAPEPPKAAASARADGAPRRARQIIF